MPLLRTGSAKSTLSMMQRRATQYQKYLTLISVFLAVTSTIVLFSSIILLKFYFMSHLYFWSIFFKVTPIFMITLGIYKFVISVYGIAISGSENKCLLGAFALLLSIAFVGQLASIFTALEVRTKIVLGNIGGVGVHENLRLYGNDSAVTSEWDTLQRELRCCGGTNWEKGFADYHNTPYGIRTNGVPDSCCHTEENGCGRNKFVETSRDVRGIFRDGCLTVLQTRLEDDVVPMMAVYAGVGVVIALADLIAVVLSAAYIAQINRRQKREAKMWSAVRGGGEEMETLNVHPPQADRMSNEHETMC